MTFSVRLCYKCHMPNNFVELVSRFGLAVRL